MLTQIFHFESEKSFLEKNFWWIDQYLGNINQQSEAKFITLSFFKHCVIIHKKINIKW
jgi:hypothetical protein